jgi:hypothetical protein
MLEYLEAAEADLANMKVAMAILQGIIDINPIMDNQSENPSS